MTETTPLDRYEIEELLGVGAGGRVYRAWDPRLERRVALKVLRTPEAGEAPLREARVQARLAHPHIAEIYEIGLHQGRPAVAMQLIDGIVFPTGPGELDFDGKLLVLEQVARAVAYAHDRGMIHRDLKPANILVERRESGPHAFVVDFGLATEIDAAGVTLTGSVVGTPEYMAPEQMRGERTRASDLYALGVLLFEAVCGRRPHQADSRVQLMLEVVRTPAEPLLRHAPTASPDLAAVVDRCLAFEPRRRYESADALAEDLSALRDGLPVSARPLTPFDRAWRWIGRHKVRASLLAALLTVGVGLTATALRERVRGARMAELSQEFAGRASDLEWTLRAIEMSPLHDSSHGRRRLEASLEDVRRRMEELGPLAVGPGHTAIGRTELALGRPRRAADGLRTAIEAGYGPPATKQALGLALAEIHGRESLIAAGLRDEDRRATRRAELDAAYRRPALALLRDLEDASPGENPHLAARLALLDGRLDRAEELASAVVRERPWLSEAEVLRAEVELARAAAAQERAEHEEADAASRRADRALARALRIAEGSVAALGTRCRLWANVLDRRLFASGGDPVEATEHGERACAAALEASPLDPAVRTAASLFRLRAGQAAERAADPAARGHVELALHHAALATVLDPDSAEAHEALGAARLEIGVWVGARGGDPRRRTRAAIESLERAVGAEPTATRWSVLGSARASLARHESLRGRDPVQMLDAAIHAQEEAILRAPDRASLHLELARTLRNRGLHELDHGLDAVPSLERAMGVVDRALGLDAESFYAHYQRAVVGWYLGDALHQAGSTAAIPTLEAALEDADRAHARNGQFASAVLIRANLHQTLATFRARRGDDPREDWAQALAALDRTVEIDPSMVWTAFVRGRLLLDRARWARFATDSPVAELLEGSVRPARQALRSGIGIHAQEPHAWADLGWGWVLEAEIVGPEGASFESALGEAAAAFDRALEIDGGCAPCLLGRGRVGLVRAEAGGTGAAEALSASLADLERSWEEDPRNPETAVDRARAEVVRCDVLQRCDGLLEAGERWIEAALDLQPDWSEARAWRGVLQVVGVERGLAGASAGRARQAFEHATRDRPDLVRAFRTWTRRLEELD